MIAIPEYTGCVFTISGFGVEKFLIPGSRDPGRITLLAVIFSKLTKVDEAMHMAMQIARQRSMT